MEKIPLFLAVIFSYIGTVHAQKFPNVQEKSIRAPAMIKIDGKAAEWNYQLQAYNKATEISYTIRNDDDKLYLTVLTADLDIANKIINAGITLTIDGSGKAKEEGKIAITFPFLYYEDQRPFLPLLDYHKEVAVWNQQLTDKIKDISVTGIPGIKDTISIYNPEGIRAAALFGQDKVFTYELALPLRYLGLSAKETKPFVYNIKLNGTPNFHIPLPPVYRIDGVPVQPSPLKEFLATLNQSEAYQHLRSKNGITGRSIVNGNMVIWGPGALMVMKLMSPTDFSAEYTLAK